MEHHLQHHHQYNVALFSFSLNRDVLQKPLFIVLVEAVMESEVRFTYRFLCGVLVGCPVVLCFVADFVNVAGQKCFIACCRTFFRFNRSPFQNTEFNVSGLSRIGIEEEVLKCVYRSNRLDNNCRRHHFHWSKCFSPPFSHPFFYSNAAPHKLGHRNVSQLCLVVMNVSRL